MKRRFWNDRRQRLFIDDLQTQLILRGLLTVALGVMICVAALFAGPTIVLLDPDSAESDRRYAAEQFLILHSQVWLGLVLVLLLAFYRLTLGAHRIAGPLYRLRAVLGDAARGDLTVRARIRKRDYLHREADTLNETLAALEARISTIRRGTREARATVESLRSRAPTPDAIDEAARVVAELDELVSEFSVAGAPADAPPSRRRSIGA